VSKQRTTKRTPRRARPAGKNPRYVVFKITEENDYDDAIAYNLRAGVTFYNSLVTHDDYRRMIYEFEFARDKHMADVIERRVLSDMDELPFAGEPDTDHATQYAVCTVN
jgi:hypothetical protein